jgi:myo-inositol-1(or 4)-monophosphatase
MESEHCLHFDFLESKPDKNILSLRNMKIEDINSLVRAAGKIALDYFGKVTIDYKADHTVVTEADLAVENFLNDSLRELIPGSAFLGEEGVAKNSDQDSEYLWIVDPIDGTSSYSKGLPVWGISVALYKNYMPYLASVYFPLVESHFWSNSDNKAFLNGKELMEISKNMEVQPNSFVCVPSNLYRDCAIHVKMKSRSFGSSCFHILQVARDAAFATILCNLGIWDLAAAEAIAEITGAKMFDINGKVISLSEIVKTGTIPEPLIVTHPDRLPQLLARIVDSKKSEGQ